jgi:hypothetical protein
MNTLLRTQARIANTHQRTHFACLQQRKNLVTYLGGKDLLYWKPSILSTKEAVGKESSLANEMSTKLGVLELSLVLKLDS